MTIKDELVAIFGENTLTTTGDIVAWARQHSLSALHRELKFDDDAGAANLWRHHHVRQLISIHIVDGDHHRRAVSLSIDRASGGGYRELSDVLNMPRLRDVLLADALEELERVQNRYESVKELANVWNEIDIAMESHDARSQRPEGSNNVASALGASAT
jgi:hypothetical protein